MSLASKYKSLERFNFQKTLEDIRRKECEKEKCVAPMDSMGAYTCYGYKWYWDNGFNVSAKYCYVTHELRLHQNDRCKRFTLF